MLRCVLHLDKSIFAVSRFLPFSLLVARLTNGRTRSIKLFFEREIPSLFVMHVSLPLSPTLFSR